MVFTQRTSRPLLIIRVDDYDDRDDVETARALPSEGWLKENQSVRGDVLGNNQRFELLSNTAADFNKSFRRTSLTWTTMITTPMPGDLRNWRTLRLVIQNAGIAVVAIIRRAGIEN